MHMKNLHGDKPEKCKLCEKCFAMPYQLNYHIRKSHENSPQKFKCDHCSKLLSTKSAYQYHVQSIHLAKIQKIECSLCQKLISKDKLKMHIENVHENSKLKCEQCDKSMRPYRLRLHMREVHEEIKNFKCNLCKKAFGQRATLHKHLKNIHDVEDEKPVNSGCVTKCQT